MNVRSPSIELCLLASLCLAGLFLGCGTEDSPKRSGSPSEASNSGSPVPRRAANLLIEAKDALEGGQFRTALALADSAERIAPEGTDVASLYFLRGRVYAQLRQYEHAKAAYEKTVEIRPDYRGGWFRLGHLAFRRAKYREALDYYQSERRHQGNHPMILHQIGRCYTHLGKRDSARQAFQQTVAQDTTFARAFLELSKLDEEQGEYDTALSNAKQALRLEPDNPEYRYQYGSLLFQMGRVKESLQPLRQVVAEAPSNRGAHYYLGQALARRGKNEEAREHLSEAERLRKLENKIDKLEGEAEVYSQQPERWIKLGRALRQAGKIDKAIEAYTIAQTLDPRNQVIRDTLKQLREGEQQSM